MSLASESAELAAPLPGAVAYAEPSMAGAGDYLALMKPRVMSLVVFTALAGLVVAPGHMHPVLAFFALLCIAVGAGAAGALNMWYDADIDAVMTRTARPAGSGGPRPARRGAGLRPDARGLLGRVPRPDDQPAGGRAARLHDLLLRRRLHDVAQALDAAEHRHRRRGRRVSADDRLGRRDRRHRPRVDPAVPHHLLLDAAALLGAVALPRRGIRRAGVPMLPVVAGAAETRRQILLYSLVLAPVGAPPWLLGYRRAGSTALSRCSAAR